MVRKLRTSISISPEAQRILRRLVQRTGTSRSNLIEIFIRKADGEWAFIDWKRTTLPFLRGGGPS